MNSQDIQAWDEHSKREAVRTMPESTSHIRRWLKEIPKGKLLDIGAGVGLDTKYAANLGFDAQGIEISREAVKIARERGIRVFICDMTDIFYQDETFDVCTAGGSIEHVPNTKDVLKEINRVLKPEGIFLFNVPYKWSFFTPAKKIQQWLGIWRCGYEKSFGEDELIALLNDAGFEVLERDWSKIEIGTRHPTLTKILRGLDKIISGRHMIWIKAKKI